MNAIPYRHRKAMGLVTPKPRILNYEKAIVIRSRYFGKKATQLQLALEYGVAECTINRVISMRVYANKMEKQGAPGARRIVKF